MKIRANGLDIEVEESPAGLSAQESRARPAVLLIMGLGMQLTAWPPRLVQAVVDAGYRVIRFDNRDMGLSTHLDHLGKPSVGWNVMRYNLGLRVRAPYSVQDMAQDSLGVLDALGIARAHVVGLSMGGMIAQRVALAAPARVLSLTIISSTSSARGLPMPRPEVLRVQMTLARSHTPRAVADNQVKMFKAIGSPAYPIPEDELRAQVQAALQRNYHPEGTLRQLLAVMADTRRAEQLPKITAPTLVLHGLADPFVPYPCAQDTAQRIPGARLVGIAGMGHDLAAPALELLLRELLPHLQAAETSAAPALP
jgi:pimeloyl-ACP methyl ester carboxylesterase